MNEQKDCGRLIITLMIYSQVAFVRISPGKLWLIRIKRAGSACCSPLEPGGDASGFLCIARVNLAVESEFLTYQFLLVM
jgi:hypothetical protein